MKNSLPLLPSFEKIPTPDHPEWKRVDGCPVDVLDNIYQLRYTINKTLVNRTVRYNRTTPKNKLYQETEKLDGVRIIYWLKDPRGESYVGSTDELLNNHLRIQLSKHQFANGEETIYEFTKTPIGVRAAVISYLKTTDQTVVDRMVRYHTRQMNLMPIRLYLKQMELIRQRMKKYRLKQTTHQIILYRETRTDRLILSSMRAAQGTISKEVTENDLLEFMVDRNKQLQQLDTPPVFKREKTIIVNTTTPTELMLLIDQQIIIHQTIKHGYNNCLRVINKAICHDADMVYRSLFISINKDLVKRYLVDNKTYNPNMVGFIYQLTEPSSDRVYFGTTSTKTIKRMMVQLYTKANAHKKKNKKIHHLLGSVPCFDIRAKMIKIKVDVDNEMDLDNEKKKLIERYDTIDNGYNDKDDIKQIKFYLLPHIRNKKIDN